MRTRRRLLAGLGAGLTVGLSGCVGFITGRHPLTFEASKASVSQSALEATGFEETRSSFQTVERDVTVAGQSRTITIKNYLAEYKRQLNLVVIKGEYARFTVFATPNVEIAGEPLNPFARMSTRELAQQLQGAYSSVDNLQQVSTRSVDVLGTSTTVTKYEGTATVSGGQQIDVFVHLTNVGDGDDTVIALAVYPRELEMQSDVDRLLRGIQH